MVVIPIQVRSCLVYLPALPNTYVLSGPKRYDYVLEQDGWIYSRDARSLNDLLNQELSDCLERKVDLGLANVSTQVD